jgi:hypothetical protein
MNLEDRRLSAELARVRASKAELEFIKAQKEDEIERIQANIDIQTDKEKELIAKGAK